MLSPLPSGSRGGGDAPRGFRSQIKLQMGERSVPNQGCHWLLVQSEDGRKDLNKLGAVRMLGMLSELGMLSAWFEPAPHHPWLHNLPGPSQDFGHH